MVYSLFNSQIYKYYQAVDQWKCKYFLYRFGSRLRGTHAGVARHYKTVSLLLLENQVNQVFKVFEIPEILILNQYGTNLLTTCS